MPKSKLLVSVIVPCYNEEGNVAECVKRINKIKVIDEIIVVDDGSKDNTSKIAKALTKKYKKLRVISYTPNRRKGGAVKAGFEKAKGDILVILDADMTVRPEDLPKFIKPLQNNKADFVNGTRFKYKMQEGAMKGGNYYANIMMGIVFSLVLGKRVTDTLCGTKAFFNKDYVKVGIDKDDPWGDFSELFMVNKLNLRYVEAPVKYYARVAGESKMNFFRDGYKMLKIFFKLVFK